MKRSQLPPWAQWTPADFIIRELIAAAGYRYDPARPLHEQGRECAHQIIKDRADREVRQQLAQHPGGGARHGEEGKIYVLDPDAPRA